MSREQRTKARNRYERKARTVAVRRPPQSRHVGICAATNKRQFETKKDAKAVNRSTGGHLAVYWCDSCPYVHLGSVHGMDRATHRAIHANDPSHIEVRLRQMGQDS